jgi:hypothetical protein
MGITAIPPIATNLADNPKNRLYRATQSGIYSVNIPVGVYEVTRQATTNIIVGSTTIVPSTIMSLLFVNEPQTSITFNSTVSSNVLPWSSPVAVNAGSGTDPQRIHWAPDHSVFVVPHNDRSFLHVSSDGISWNYRSMGGHSTSSFWGLARGAGMYVLAQAGTPQIGWFIRNSTDLVSWSTRQSAGMSARGVAYGNGRFVLAGRASSTTADFGQVCWSTNATADFIGLQTITSGEWFHSCTFDAGLFVIGGTLGSLYTSTDGTTWTARNSRMGGNTIRDIQYGGGNFVAVGGNASSSVSVSTDGITWSARNVGGNLWLYNATYNPDDGSWAVSNNGVEIRVSTDLSTWTARAFPAGKREYGIAYGNGRYLYTEYVDSSNFRARILTTGMLQTVPTVPFTDTYIILEYKGTTRVLS